MAYNYRWPLRQVETITSFYGDASPENIAKGYAANHIGIDIAADIGTAVYPCADGYIESYGNTTERGNYVNILLIDGNTMVIQHLLYPNLENTGLNVGSAVTSNDVIGYVGQSGANIDIPHLHFEIIKGSTLYRASEAGLPENPMKYLDLDKTLVTAYQANINDQNGSITSQVINQAFLIYKIGDNFLVIGNNQQKIFKKAGQNIWL